MHITKFDNRPLDVPSIMMNVIFMLTGQWDSANELQLRHNW